MFLPDTNPLSAACQEVWCNWAKSKSLRCMLLEILVGVGSWALEYTTDTVIGYYTVDIYWCYTIWIFQKSTISRIMKPQFRSNVGGERLDPAAWAHTAPSSWEKRWLGAWGYLLTLGNLHGNGLVWKAIKENEDNRRHPLTLDQGCFHTHRKLEHSHFLSTGSSPPEKTIRVKKNDNVILGNLKKHGVLIQPHFPYSKPSPNVPSMGGIDHQNRDDVLLIY